MKHRDAQTLSGRSLWGEDLAQAERHIVAVKKQIARQREVIAGLAEAEQSADIAVSLLHAMEDSLRAFDRHRELILKRLKGAG
jgi:hypothetical protein